MYILSGTRGDYECKNFDIKPGEYMLKTIKEPYPSYKSLKRTQWVKVHGMLKTKYLRNICLHLVMATLMQWLDANEPGMTITRNFACVSSSRCIYPYLNRGLTAREAARIQSYPDNYVFKGSKSDIRLQIGNSVPPVLSEKIANAIIEMLDECSGNV